MSKVGVWDYLWQKPLVGVYNLGDNLGPVSSFTQSVDGILFHFKSLAINSRSFVFILLFFDIFLMPQLLAPICSSP